ncbi:LytR/AlgR family response regulator transcription factor [Hymenobacter sp. IS2118]|uniref:LytR/AlgR family response regulator transcription factor n=1 Tax=Hymenobacter sp. IS2118 TaxID=1505605 RepID=UPI0006893AED|nr:response regulator transcription factor [Hymenobacter sp. IS2118]
MENLRKLSVLVVEDEALIAENLRLTLEDLGYHVIATCYTYAEAQAALAPPAPVPDLVLLDINLGHADPARTGLALGRQLAGQGGPPFIFLTAYSDLDTVRQATQLRPSGYLVKPVSSGALFAAIQLALDRATTHQPAPLPAEVLPAAASSDIGPAFFFVKLGERTHKLSWTAVQRLEAGKNYVTLHLAGQQAGYPVRGSLTYVLDQLLPASLSDHFIRVNRRLVLNAACITGYDEAYVGSSQETKKIAR